MEQQKQVVCPDCGDTVEVVPATPGGVDRRSFLKTVTAAAAAAATGGLSLWAVPKVEAAPTPKSAAETAVKALYDSLTEQQKKVVCFDWDHKHPVRGLLRTHVSNNWHITEPKVDDDPPFFTRKQRWLIHDIFKSLFSPEWYGKIVRQLKDDTNGRPWGAEQNIAIFGKPGTNQFEFVMTGRHMTIRADGNTESRMALGGPIFHGHQASQVMGLQEKVNHPGNIFWHQALMANKVYQLLDGKQQDKALQPRRPSEWTVPFRGKDGKFPGIPIAELSSDQKEAVNKVLLSLVEPYRPEDQDKIQACLKKHGGLEACSLAFYRDGDMGDDGEWDNWRIEGPSFVWYFRGEPHVHIWINVGEDPSIPLNSRNL
jgi:hypothetical protein